MRNLIDTLGVWLRALQGVRRMSIASYLLLPLVLLSATGCSSMKDWVLPQGVKLGHHGADDSVVVGIVGKGGSSEEAAEGEAAAE